MRLFSLSDIHGCPHSLSQLLDQLKLNKSDQVVFCGDYINKGPDSIGVLDILLDLRKRLDQLVLLRGNHEEMLLEARLEVLKAKQKKLWSTKRDTTTLPRILDKKSIHLLDQSYWDLLESMPYYYEKGDYIFVHAGLNFMGDNLFADRYTLLYERDWYQSIDYAKLQKRKIIHGHTPQSAIRSMQQLSRLDKDQVLCIDGGCVNTPDKPTGNLLGVELTQRKLFIQPNVDLNRKS